MLEKEIATQFARWIFENCYIDEDDFIYYQDSKQYSYADSEDMDELFEIFINQDQI